MRISMAHNGLAASYVKIEVMLLRVLREVLAINDHRDEKETRPSGTNEDYFSDEEAERYFNEELGEEDEESIESPPERTWIKKVIAVMLAVVLLGNIIAFMPQIYSLPAFQFLKKNRELSQNEQIQQYKQAVVTVNASGRKGTGFNIASEGVIITNQHVVEDDRLSVVNFPHGKSYTAELIISDPNIDIAVLKVQTEEAEEFPVLELQSDETVWHPDAPVYVIGNPLFFYQIANEGEVIGITTAQATEPTFLLLDAPIYKGNSGSPVIDREGKVIAVVFATTKIKMGNSTRKVGLATPTNAFMKYLQ